MSVEARMLAVLEASTNPVLVRARKAYGYIEQDDEKLPTVLPVLVVQRATAEYLNDFCGVYDCCFVTVEVKHVARGAEESRAQANAARLLLSACSEEPQLETESEEFDSELRGWLVTQSWRVFDSAPDVTQP
jgi:hypothetical protein